VDQAAVPRAKTQLNIHADEVSLVRRVSIQTAAATVSATAVNFSETLAIMINRSVGICCNPGNARRGRYKGVTNRGPAMG